MSKNEYFFAEVKKKFATNKNSSPPPPPQIFNCESLISRQICDLCPRLFLHKWKRNEWSFRPFLCTCRLNWARRTSWGWWDEWDDTALQTQNSLRPGTLPLGHGGSPQYWIFTGERGTNILFFWNLNARAGSNPRSPTFQTGSFNHCTRAAALLCTQYVRELVLAKRGV